MTQKKEIDFTSDQLEAINYTEGNLQIIACAGSGKTEVITRRVIKLISDGVNPENIVAFTFTVKAAEEMKYRIRKYISEEHPEFLVYLGNMFIGTIHSFCYELLKNYEPKYHNYDVLDENQTILFLKRFYWKLELNHLKIKTPLEPGYDWKVVNIFKKNADIIREELINYSKLSDKNFKKSFKLYIDLLEKKKFLDFSGLLSKIIEILKNNLDILKKIQERYKYIIIDEYQDINNVQERLIELMITETTNICVVGDDDQAIYQWRGADISNILQFSDKYKPVKKINLEQNFRSTKNIVKNAHSLIIRNENRLRKIMFSKKTGEKEDVNKIEFKNQEEEVDFIVNQIKTLHGAKFLDKQGIERALNWDDFALLFRSVKNHSEPYIEALKKNDIRCIVKGSIGLFENPEISKILDILNHLFIDPTKSNYVQFDKLTENKAIETIISLLDDKSRKGIQTKIFKNHFEKSVKDLKLKYSSKKKINLQRVFQEILQVILQNKYQFREDIFYNLGQLSQFISDFEGVNFPVKISRMNEFFITVDRFAREAYEMPLLEERFGNANVIQIMTMHRSKGLEFPVVFLPAMVNHAFPRERPLDLRILIDSRLFNPHRYKTTEESQRRLLYMAITRSKKYLYITYSKKMEQYIKLNNPSQFLIELNLKYLNVDPGKIPKTRETSTNILPSKVSYFPTNFSEVGYYFDCPKDYQYRFIFGFKPELVELLGYGKSIHNILNICHKEFQAEGKLKDEKFDEIFKDNFHLPFASEVVKNAAFLGAYNMVKDYIDAYHDDLKHSIETEKRFEILIGEILISGEMDLIRRKSKKTDDLIIIDFKTEKNPDTYRQKKHIDQLILYGLGLKSLFGKHPASVYIHYLDDGTRVKATFDTKKIAALLKKFEKVVNDIQNNYFQLDPYDIKRCTKCDFKRICLTKT